MLKSTALTFLCLLLAACGPAGEAMYAATDAGNPDIEEDTSLADIADTDTEQADATEADAAEEVGEPVSCEPFEGLIQENMTDCGVITIAVWGASECASTQISCVLDALESCTPFFLYFNWTQMLDVDDVYLLVYSTGSLGAHGQCEYSVVKDALTTEYDYPEANAVVHHDGCTSDHIGISGDMCSASFESNCASTEVLGTCADVYASCPLCTEGRP